MGAPTVYRWDDANAPVARGERSSLHDILYACLVTGYGSKTGRGWTREFVNATFDKAAFRPGSGNRFFLQIDGNGTANAYTHNIQAYEAMSSESDGLLPWYASAQSMLLSSSAGTTARPWVLIADDRAFWFICWYSLTSTPGIANTSVSGMFFGDGIPWYPSDCYFTGLFAGITGFCPPLYAAASAIGGYTYEFRFPRNHLGAVGSAQALYFIHNGGPCATANYPGATGLVYNSGDPILFARPYISNSVAYSIRGWLPGIHYPCHPHPFSQQIQQLTLNDELYLAFKTTGVTNTVCSYLISLADWRE